MGHRSRCSHQALAPLIPGALPLLASPVPLPASASSPRRDGLLCHPPGPSAGHGIPRRRASRPRRPSVLAACVGPACVDSPPVFSGLALCSGPDAATDPAAPKSFACAWGARQTPAPPCAGGDAAGETQASGPRQREMRRVPRTGRTPRGGAGVSGECPGEAEVLGGRAVWGKQQVR